MHGSHEGKSRYIGRALLAVRAAVARTAARRYNALSLQFIAVIPRVILSFILVVVESRPQ
jgi:hypothetical protein